MSAFETVRALLRSSSRRRRLSRAPAVVRCEPLEERRLLAWTEVYPGGGPGATYINRDGLHGTTGVGSVAYDWSPTQIQDWPEYDWETGEEYYPHYVDMGNDEALTFTLTNLPAHTHARIRWGRADARGPGYADGTSSMSGTAGGTAMEFGASRYPDEEYWYFSAPVHPHTGSTWEMTMTGTGFPTGSEPGATWDDWRWAPVQMYVDVFMPVVRISGGGATSENGGPVTFTVSRDEDASMWGQALTVNLDVTGSAEAADFEEGLPSSVTIEPGQGSTTITLTPKDDAIAEAPEGQPGATELVSIGVASGSGYQATYGPPPFATVADDARWWYTDWKVGPRPKPQMRGPLNFMGEKEQVDTDPHTGAEQKTVDRYYYYDKLVPFAGTEISGNFGEPVEVDRTISWGESFTWGGGLGLSIPEVGPVNINFTLYDFRTADITTVGSTPVIPVTEAGPNEKVAVTPLIKKRFVIHERHTYARGPGVADWTWQNSIESESDIGATGDTDYAVFAFQRRWHDEEADEVDDLSGTPPQDQFEDLLAP